MLTVFQDLHSILYNKQRRAQLGDLKIPKELYLQHRIYVNLDSLVWGIQSLVLNTGQAPYKWRHAQFENLRHFLKVEAELGNYVPIYTEGLD